MTAFFDGLEAIKATDPKYQLGQAGQNGYCDCIGYIIGALRRAGGSWGRVHGSNYALRYETRDAFDIQSVNDLKIGMVVYKYYQPGNPRYKLPASYANHPDQKDYYHVGVVRSVTPMRIEHCTTTASKNGIVTDTKLGAWKVAGWLKRVDKAASGDELMAYASPDGGGPAEKDAKRNLRVIKGLPLLRGEDVRQVQERLISLGYSTGPKGADGIYGWDTRGALLAWQMTAFPGNPADWDGIVGPKTWLKLMEGKG